MFVNENATQSQRRRILLTVVVVVGLVAVVLGGFVYRMSAPSILNKAELKANGAYLLETPRHLKEFRLIDHRGEPFTQEDLEGHWTLVFFGFTHCPDVCPTTMSFLADFREALDEDERDDLEIVMISVDPARDTPERLADYVPFFDPSFTGVTGEFLEIHRVATALNAPFRKVPGQGENYQVDHSANLVLLNPRGDYHAFFKAPLDMTRLKMTYRSIVADWDY